MSSKKRLNLEIENGLHDTMERIQGRIGAASLTEVVRRAVKLLDEVSIQYEKKGKVIFQDSTGKQECMRFLF